MDTLGHARAPNGQARRPVILFAEDFDAPPGITVFDDPPGGAEPVAPAFTEEELAAARADAYSEGHSNGLAKAAADRAEVTRQMLGVIVERLDGARAEATRVAEESADALARLDKCPARPRLNDEGCFGAITDHIDTSSGSGDVSTHRRKKHLLVPQQQKQIIDCVGSEKVLGQLLWACLGDDRSLRDGVGKNLTNLRVKRFNCGHVCLAPLVPVDLSLRGLRFYSLFGH